MTNAISDAKTIGQVVDAINSAAAGQPVEYFGGSDTRAAHEMARQYALDAALESGYTDSETVEYHLGHLIDAGAIFDFQAALQGGS